MRAIQLREPRQFDVIDRPRPDAPAPDEALVRVRHIGICGTDLHAFEGRQTFFTYPRVLGHELAVEVEAVGSDVTRFRAGDRCAVVPYWECGQCAACRRGTPNCCERLSVLGVHQDGGMCEVLRVPARKLKRSESLSLEELALVEPLCIGMHAWRRGAVVPGASILVIGAGPIGLAVASAAQAYGEEAVLLDTSERRRRFAEETLGLGRCLAPGEDRAVAVRETFGGEMPFVVFDCTGNPGSMNSSVLLCAHGGTLVFVGHHPGDITLRNPDFHARELTLKASRNATDDDFTTVIDLLEQGRLRPQDWITHRVGLSEMPEQFASWLQPDNGAVKPMVVV